MAASTFFSQPLETRENGKTLGTLHLQFGVVTVNLKCNYKHPNWDENTVIHIPATAQQTKYQRKHRNRYTDIECRTVHHATIFQNYAGKEGHPLELLNAAAKWARGTVQVERLRKEYHLYTKELNTLQGWTVPKLHGYCDDIWDGVPTACLILEWYNSLPCAKEDAMYVVTTLMRYKVFS
jgi:hypothetical protein